MQHIRKANAKDAHALSELYFYHLYSTYPDQEQDMEKWEALLTKLESNDLYNILVVEIDGKVVATSTVIVIENLTHNVRPYCLIENFVTHNEYRGYGCALVLKDAIEQIALKNNCYKIMFMTGKQKKSILRFYEAEGYSSKIKKAFVKYL